MKKLILISLLLCVAFTVFAQESGITSSQSLGLQISTAPEAKLNFTQSFKIPFLNGDNPLTSGNNVNVSLGADVTPITLEGIVDVTWTPIAFFNFSVGGKFGSGWNLPLFGSELRGIGLNKADGSGDEEYSGSAFDALLWRAQAGATLQFDLAAVIPGDWNHVVMQSYHEINYKGNTRAKAGESWYYQHDAGENQNGLNYYGNLLLGYQMPLVPILNTIGFMAEADLYLYDNTASWGGDLIRWTLSNAYMLDFTENLGAMLIVQFRSRRNFTEGKESDLNKADSQIYYQNRHINTSDPTYLEFYRVALSLTYKF
jgi:hypothetical protein